MHTARGLDHTRVWAQVSGTSEQSAQSAPGWRLPSCDLVLLGADKSVNRMHQVGCPRVVVDDGEGHLCRDGPGDVYRCGPRVGSARLVIEPTFDSDARGGTEQLLG